MKQQLNKTIYILSGLILKTQTLNDKSNTLITQNNYDELYERINQLNGLLNNTTEETIDYIKVDSFTISQIENLSDQDSWFYITNYQRDYRYDRIWSGRAMSVHLNYRDNMWVLRNSNCDNYYQMYTFDDNPFTSTNWKWLGYEEDVSPSENDTPVTITFENIVFAE